MRTAARVGIVGALVAAVISAGSTVGATTDNNGRGRLSAIDHIVVIYEENHSFDNLFGELAGRRRAQQEARPTRRGTTQVDTTGTPLNCLLQKDVNLDLAAAAGDAVHAAGRAPPCRARSPTSRSRSTTFITPTDTTCPTPAQAFIPANANGVLKGTGLPGGCTRDLVHKFYQEQYQIDGGKMDRYTVGSDAAGLTQGYYDTRSCRSTST